MTREDPIGVSRLVALSPTHTRVTDFAASAQLTGHLNGEVAYPGETIRPPKNKAEGARTMPP